MQPAVDSAASPAESSWHVSREGSTVAMVAVNHEGGNVVVTADVEGGASKSSPYRFSTLQAAEEFVNDLMASFAYLGCDVARA